MGVCFITRRCGHCPVSLSTFPNYRLFFHEIPIIVEELLRGLYLLILLSLALSTIVCFTRLKHVDQSREFKNKFVVVIVSWNVV